MIYSVTQEEMEKLLRREDPIMTDEAVARYAQKYLKEIDQSLEGALEAYIHRGEKINVRVGEFSIKIIQKLRGCQYFQALMLLNGYIKDNELGRSMILI